MTDAIQLKKLSNMKDLLMRMGINVPAEELEKDLRDIPDPDEKNISPATYDLISHYLGKYGSNRYENTEDNTDILGTLSAIKSCLGAGCFCLAEGLAGVEYSGRSKKVRKGEYIILIKPDRSVVVHGPSGVAPICYLNRPTEIKPCDCEGKIGLSISGEGEQLSIVFDKLISFQGLFTPLPDKKALTNPDMTEEERRLEVLLKTLRKTLALENNLTYLPAIYDNRVLLQLVKTRPASIEELGQVKGFGSTRIQKYGRRVIETINGARASACP